MIDERRRVGPTVPLETVTDAFAADTTDGGRAIASFARATAYADVEALPIADPDQYEIQGEIARGGLGRILKVRDRRLGRDLVIKELIRNGPGEAARFLR